MFKVSHRFAPISWGLALAAITGVVSSFARVSVSRVDLLTAIQILLPIFLLIAVLVLVFERLNSDPSGVAQILRITAERSSAIFIGLSGLLLVMGCGGVLSFQGAAAAFPLQDANLAKLDRLLGFDWLASLAWFDANPTIARAMRYFYTSSSWLIPAVGFMLVIIGRIDKAYEYIVLYAITMIIVVLLASLFPASGAYHYFQPPSELTDHLTSSAGRYHLAQFWALREGSLTTVGTHNLTGLVTFPSFHTVMALLTIHALRGLRWCFWASLLLNGGVIVSTIPEGGHYVTDVIAAMAITAIAVGIVHRWLDGVHGLYPAVSTKKIVRDAVVTAAADGRARA